MLHIAILKMVKYVIMTMAQIAIMNLETTVLTIKLELILCWELIVLHLTIIHV